MPTVDVELRNVAGTGAAMGWAGAHTLIADRPEGRAGGMGLGFNGGQLLALALGGCFCNDLRYAADRMGVTVGAIDVRVRLDLDGAPLVVQAATVTARVTSPDGDSGEVVREAQAMCTVANSLIRGVPVTFE